MVNISSSITSTTRINNVSVYLFAEHQKYNESLHQVTLFPYINSQKRSSIAHGVLFFRFRSIEFNKKRALPFFLAIELLSNRKCVASLSEHNVQAWKIRKGMLVGCKVTLRREALVAFFDTLRLTFPRMEKFQPTRWSKKITQRYLKKINSFYSFSLMELVRFHCIEFGIGLHPDLQKLNVSFYFNSLPIEERFFLLRSNKIPIILF